LLKQVVQQRQQQPRRHRRQEKRKRLAGMIRVGVEVGKNGKSAIIRKRVNVIT